MENIYRKIGFVAWFSILLAVLAVCFILALDVWKGPHLLKVSFPNVGTLILQEPVLLHGVNVGLVAGIEYTRVPNPDFPEAAKDSTREAALVTIEFDKRLKLPRDSKIINFNHSMMGARLIFIEMGKDSEDMDFDEIQEGIFREGIAEMLHKTVKLLHLVQRYQKLLTALSEGTDSTVSVFEFYDNSFKPFFEKYSLFVDEMLQSGEETKARVEMAKKYTGQLASFSSIVETGLLEIAGKTEFLLREIGDALEAVDRMAEKIKAQVALMSREESVLRKLIYERDLFESLKKLNNSLNAVVKVLHREGVKDVIDFWENVHILGRNPSKRRQEQRF